MIVVDGLRSDKCHGQNKTSLTPNLDSLISNGVLFRNTISSSDGTRTCVGSIVTAQYPFQSGLNTFHNHKKSTKFFDLLKKHGYSLAATVPDVDMWKVLTENFDTKDMIPKPYEYLFGGTGKKILLQLEKLNKLQPWIYYIHIMDLHRGVYFPLPEKFQDTKFGQHDYEKMVSGIDFWMGEILKKIDRENTLIVLTADHGEFLPISSINHEISYIHSLVNFAQKIKKITPKKLQPLGESAFIKVRELLIPIYKQRLKKKLSDSELRTLNVRGSKHGWELFEEVVCTPLLFSGCGINNNIISQQVRQVDIFPTISDIVKLPKIDGFVEGKSLLPLIDGKKMDEEPASIQNHLLEPNDTDIVIGIRTSQYKYFRSINDKKTKLRLFDLKNDPTEQNDISSNSPDIINQMENLLSKIRTVHTSNNDDIQDDYEQEIKDELKKMGYI